MMDKEKVRALRIRWDALRTDKEIRRFARADVMELLHEVERLQGDETVIAAHHRIHDETPFLTASSRDYWKRRAEEAEAKSGDAARIERDAIQRAIDAVDEILSENPNYDEARYAAKKRLRQMKAAPPTSPEWTRIGGGTR